MAETAALRPAPFYTPFDPIPHKLTMGLQSLAWPDWIQPCDRLPADLAERARLLDDHHAAVFAVLPDAEAACAELRDRLADHLPRHHPAVWRREGDRMTILPTGASAAITGADRHPLETAGRWVQEDLVIMQDAGDGAGYRLTAACLCFPTRWALADKIGRPMPAIHGPVPHYADRLARPVDRFMGLLAPDKPVWRVNWSLNDNPALFQPKGHGRAVKNPAITPENAGETIHLRTERQTLSRLPASRAVVFTIRVHVRPLREALDADARRRLAAALRAMGADHARYQSLPAFSEAVLGWLDAHIAGRRREPNRG